MRIISADDHVNPPATIYSERLPRDLRDRAPRVERRGDREVVVFEGTEKPFSNLQGSAGVDAKSIEVWSKSKKVGRRGGWDPAARIEDMDLDGVDAQVLFGSGDGGGIEIRSENRPLRFAMMQVYNDWLAEHCKAYPKRTVGIAEIPHWDIELAIAEAKRAAKLGLRGVLISAIPAYQDSPPEDKPYTDPYYEPLWSALEELRMPINMHLGTKPLTRGLLGNIMVQVSVNKSMMSEPIASFIFSGVLMRHPELKLVSVESGIGWMAFLVPWMDATWNKHRHHTQSKLEEPPSFYFHRQVFGTFIDDVVGVRNRDIIGVDNIMWSSDYPHINSSWPNSREYIEKHFGDVPEAERAKMVGGNAAHVYGL
jgi:predicted TIM-barrel fold metal-dependent hydrolase